MVNVVRIRRYDVSRPPALGKECDGLVRQGGIGKITLTVNSCLPMPRPVPSYSISMLRYFMLRSCRA
jgi:hypothetical protein